MKNPTQTKKKPKRRIRTAPLGLMFFFHYRCKPTGFSSHRFPEGEQPSEKSLDLIHSKLLKPASETTSLITVIQQSILAEECPKFFLSCPAYLDGCNALTKGESCII